MIVKLILLISTSENLWRTVWRWWSLMLGSKGLKKPLTIWATKSFETRRYSAYSMITNLKVGHNKGLTLHLFDIIDEELTSSFVVWFEPTKYEWKPVNPTIDQIEKKQIIASKIVQKVKDTISNHEKCNCASTVWHDLIICSVIFIIFCSYCLLQFFFP